MFYLWEFHKLKEIIFDKKEYYILSEIQYYRSFLGHIYKFDYK